MNDDFKKYIAGFNVCFNYDDSKTAELYETTKAGDKHPLELFYDSIMVAQAEYDENEGITSTYLNNIYLEGRKYIIRMYKFHRDELISNNISNICLNINTFKSNGDFGIMAKMLQEKTKRVRNSGTNSTGPAKFYKGKKLYTGHKIKTKEHIENLNKFIDAIKIEIDQMSAAAPVMRPRASELVSRESKPELLDLDSLVVGDILLMIEDKNLYSVVNIVPNNIITIQLLKPRNEIGFKINIKISTPEEKNFIIRRYKKLFQKFLKDLPTGSILMSNVDTSTLIVVRTGDNDPTYYPEQGNTYKVISNEAKIQTIDGVVIPKILLKIIPLDDNEAKKLSTINKDHFTLMFKEDEIDTKFYKEFSKVNDVGNKPSIYLPAEENEEINEDYEPDNDDLLLNINEDELEQFASVGSNAGGKKTRRRKTHRRRRQTKKKTHIRKKKTIKRKRNKRKTLRRRK